MLLVIDHHDSFTWNLVHALGRYAPDVQVQQSDALSVEQVRALRPRGLVLSPGPGHPDDAKQSLALISALANELPMLGVCLGHQLLCRAFGARVLHAPDIFHGRVSAVHHDGSGLFAGVASPFLAARYHSLMVDAATLPPELLACASTDSGELMAVRHRSLPLFSVQFHPESFLTEHGSRIVQTFVQGLPAHSPLDAKAVRVSA